MEDRKDAKLVLEDGSSFSGVCFGAKKSVSGEVVFNTGMTGYPESLTDPSYSGQILVLTYPLQGNYGVPDDESDKKLAKNFESDNIQVRGLVVLDYSKDYSHHAAARSLSDWLKRYDIPAITGIDTRMVTKKLREKGVVLGKVVIDKDIECEDPNVSNLVSQVSIKEPVFYEKGRQKIVLIDCGVKNNIIRSLTKRNCTVIKVPWNYDFFKYEFDGVVISNGPGDPKMCKDTISNISKAIQQKMPILGICLGNQILALAAGGDTYKLKYGHRSQNQPCVMANTSRCFITSQNHGYAVNTKSLSVDWKEWFYNANDSTNEGIIHKSGLFRSVQFHPEATPGPVDTDFLFDDFLKMITEKKKNASR